MVGGQLSAAEDLLFAGIREVAYRRSLPLATRKLQILPSKLGEGVGLLGLARLVIDHIYSGPQLAQLMSMGALITRGQSSAS